jgi:hypothetical protein
LILIVLSNVFIDTNQRSLQVAKSRPADWISRFPVTDGHLQVTFMRHFLAASIQYCIVLMICLFHHMFQIIKNNDLEELQELGSGTFGTVYHGKWRGTDVAIKRINDRCFAGKPSEQEKMVCFHMSIFCFWLHLYVY